MESINIEEEKIKKKIEINGVNVEIELSKSEAKEFPKKLESTIRIKDRQIPTKSLKIPFLYNFEDSHNSQETPVLV